MGLRILTISNTPLTLETGSGYVVRSFAEGLTARGHQVSLRGPADFEPLRAFQRAIQYRQAVGMARCVLRETRRCTFDLIEFYGAEAWLAFLALRRRGPRPLMAAHSNGLEPHAARQMSLARRAGTPGLDRRWWQLDQTPLFAAGFRRADGIVTVSEWERAFALAERYGDEQHVVAIENALPDCYIGLPVELSRPSVVGFCGSWLSGKGIHLVRDAVSHFLAANPGWRLLLVGVGDGFRLRDNFDAGLLARIDVVPRADRSTSLRELYLRMAILVVPSAYESFGLVAAEAMACGCAVVGTRVGFLASLKNEEEAVLIDRPVSAALRDALQRLATNADLRAHVAQGGYRRVQQLEWRAAIAKLEQTYERWVAERRDRSS